MTTALASLLSGRPIKHTVGMTGEVTLQGRVLPDRRAQAEGARGPRGGADRGDPARAQPRRPGRRPGRRARGDDVPPGDGHRRGARAGARARPGEVGRMSGRRLRTSNHRARGDLLGGGHQAPRQVRHDRVPARPLRARRCCRSRGLVDERTIIQRMRDAYERAQDRLDRGAGVLLTAVSPLHPQARMSWRVHAPLPALPGPAGDGAVADRRLRRPRRRLAVPAARRARRRDPRERRRAAGRCSSPG